MADCFASVDFSEALQKLGEHDPNAAAAKAKQQLDDLDNVALNIAVIGETGAGKSTFINAFRGLDDDEDMSAPTGITETTNEVNMYTHPTKPNVKLWDLPGIGMPNLKADQYLKKVKFETYDFFIIISSTRFKENDIFLAKEIQKKKKHFYFVRTKIDNDINSAARSRNFDELEALSSIREDCRRQLKEVGNPKVFLISSYDLGKYDFQNLVDTIELELSEQKRLALVVSLPVCSLAMLEKKKQMMKMFIMPAAFASCIGGFFSVPLLSFAVDKIILMAFFTRCYYMFGLNENSLEKLSLRVNKPVAQLKSPIKSPFILALVDKFKVVTPISPTKPGISFEELIDVKVLVKMCQNGAQAFKTTYVVLSEGLNEMADDMTQVLRVAGLQ